MISRRSLFGAGSAAAVAAISPIAAMPAEETQELLFPVVGASGRIEWKPLQHLKNDYRYPYEAFHQQRFAPSFSTNDYRYPYGIDPGAWCRYFDDLSLEK
jgi:hypothetical protein